VKNRIAVLHITLKWIHQHRS